MRSKTTTFILISILLLSIVLRFYKLSTNFIFKDDQSEDLFRLEEISTIFKSGKFQYLPTKVEAGTDLSRENQGVGDYMVYSGAFYFYALLPLAVVSQFNPVWLTVFFAILNLISIIPMYLVGKILFNKKVGLFAAILFSTSYWMNAFSRVIWNASPVPFLVSISLWLMLLIKKGNTKIWPFFLFSLGALTQVHNSGYYYCLLFIVLSVVLRLPRPKLFLHWILSIILFLIPMIPSILYEILTGFKFVPQVFHSLFFLSNGYPINIAEVFSKFWDFWSSSINPWQFSSYLGDVYGTLGKTIQILFVVLSLSFIFFGIFSMRNVKNAKKIFSVFFVGILVLPLVLKIYYQDNHIQGMVLWGATFSLIGALPFVFLWQASLLDYIWNKNRLGRLISILILSLVAGLNILAVITNIWNKGDPIFNYGDKVLIVEALKKDVGNNKYSFDIIDKYADGREFLYLFDYNNMSRPSLFNGEAFVGSSLIKYDLPGGKPEIIYVIVTQENWGSFVVGNDGSLIAQIGNMRLYRQIFNQ